MSADHSEASLPSSVRTEIDRWCDRFESSWRSFKSTDDRPELEQYLADWPHAGRDTLFLELLLVELAYRQQYGETPRGEEYQQRFPEYGHQIDVALDDNLTVSQVASLSATDNTAGIVGHLKDRRANHDEPIPERIGRYGVRQLIDSGAFGSVYLAYDDTLERVVAIKVPHRHVVSCAEDVRVFLEEARTVATIDDHPNIVPVYDAGQLEDGRCFVVSKWIKGTDLAKRIRHQRLSVAETVELVATVAEALNYAHSKRLVHRDIKPANILIDAAGKPYVADFGLALKEEDYGTPALQGGTIAYMSPEQARGEGHLVDGRSDIFSLGVVLYQLLTDERPFGAADRRSVLRQIKSVDARPPRQIDIEVPRELERICLKALEKRASDRYTTAHDLAEDLRHFLTLGDPAETSDAATSSTGVNVEVENAASPVKVIPKGLRSFDANDADFFLGLLPGPRDRDGLPESIRFWKSRIEQLQAEETFRVGLMYGPSGSGKSSLVKAGLLPRLTANVLPVYVEATGEETEARLLHRLRRTCAGLPPDGELVATLTDLRRGQTLPPNSKVLIILDQFEQWLHVWHGEDNSPLVQGLRQCDGEHLQCLILVRDDFWLAVSRFMDQLEVDLVQGENTSLVDLFDPDHGYKVLTELGKAYGRVPDDLRRLSADQDRFLKQVLSGSSQGGKVVPVQLALVAEMVKDKPWTRQTLRTIGGTEGIGVTFLEETFCAAGAPPNHRRHQKAAQAVLRSLRPESGTDLSVRMRSRRELLEASGYANQPRMFSELMRILDAETRLITPCDPEVAMRTDHPTTGKTDDEKYYQLTHDYLVPSLREWLRSKQRETRRGRAKLMLSERSTMWNARPERRQLPFGWEWLTILLFTKRRRWTVGQRKMMRSARKLHLTRGLVTALVIAVVGIGVRWPILGVITRYHVTEARQAWHQGREDDAVGALRKAAQARPDDPAVLDLRLEMKTEGGATFDTVPADLQVEVVPDQTTDGDLGLTWKPRVISVGRSRFRSGEHIRLAVGHYRVRLYRSSDEPVADFPLFIDRVTYDVISGDRSWSPHSGTERPDRQTPSNDPRRFDLAEQVKFRLVIPDEIPDGLVYVNPGPMWRGPDPRLIDSRPVERTSQEDEPKVEVETHDGTDPSLLVRDSLENGFLIAAAETTVGDLRTWWGNGDDDLGSQYCDWRIPLETRISEAVAETADIPLEVHRACWRAELESRGIDPAGLTHGEILAAVFQDLHDSCAGTCKEYRETITARIMNASAADDARPVTVSWETAVAYARTHAPIDSTRFRLWVARMVNDSKGYAAALERLSTSIEKRQGRFVQSSELPEGPLVRDLLSPIEANEHPRRVLDAYCYWLEVRTYYGWQLPIEQVLVVDKEGSPAKVAQPALKPFTWLWRKRNTAGSIRASVWPPRQSVDAYAEAVFSGKKKPLRTHFLRWLGWMIHQEEAERRTYTKLLQRLDDPADDVIAKLPFAVRYRYGVHLGWDIPTWKEWERAYRGADARAFTWGNVGSDMNAWLDRGEDGRGGPLTAIGATSTVHDKSPYGLLHMAGNLSEWVRVSDRPLRTLLLKDGTHVMEPVRTAWNASFPARVFLKGGNYVKEARFANAGLTFSLRSGYSQRPGSSSRGAVTRWTGFRVLRRIDSTGVRGGG